MGKAFPDRGSRQRIAIVGCGFFGKFQINAWKQLERAEIVAVCDRDEARARAASEIAGGVPYYLDVEEMLRKTEPDVVDIVTMPRAHLPLARLCARYKKNAIIQKPIAMNLADAVTIVETARRAGVTMAVHENTRFQRPIREVKKIVQSGAIGEPRYCWVSRRTTYAPFARDPVLRNGERIILADMGAHVFDIAHYLMGDIKNLSCRTLSMTENIAGDEMASALVGFASGAIGVVSCSSVSQLPNAPNLDVYVTVEGTKGSAVITADSRVTIRTGDKVETRQIEVPIPNWGSNHWKVVQDSVVSVCSNWLAASAGLAELENSVEDNLRTFAAVEACYASAAADGALVSLADVLAAAYEQAGYGRAVVAR